ncbi:MAG: hypothetical protein GC158_00240 [Cyanobacteria bacterium RI_101]|nr:hypothetical protein [Cyanobacteria bacterium RI_101]
MSENENLRLDRIETTLENQGGRLDRIETTLENQGGRLDRIETALGNLITEIKIYDGKLDAYQKASQQVVNIAFGLLATAALSVIIPAVLNK